VLKFDSLICIDEGEHLLGEPWVVEVIFRFIIYPVRFLQLSDT